MAEGFDWRSALIGSVLVANFRKVQVSPVEAIPYTPQLRLPSDLRAR